MDRKKQNQLKKWHTWLRAEIQIVFFIFLPSIYTSAFGGVKYIFEQLGAAEKIGMSTFLENLIVICIFTIIFGRFFCGFACAFGSLGDFMHFVYTELCKKIKKKPVQLPRGLARVLYFVKYLILVLIVLMCFGGVFSRTHGMSPWDVFSLLRAGHFALGDYAVGIVFFVLILVGMCIEERFFCKFLCPMGAVFALLPVLPVFSLARDRESCIKGCSACTKKCPSDVELPEAGKPEVCGDCFQCQKCIDTCPKGNIHTGIARLKGNEIWFTVLRAALLFVIFWLLGMQ